MSVRKENIYQLIDQLTVHDQKTVYDFLAFLINQRNKPACWEEIDNSNLDDDPLNEEEIKQLKSTSGYITWEEGKHEFQISVDL